MFRSGDMTLRLAVAGLADYLSLLAVAIVAPPGHTDDPSSGACLPLKQLSVTYLAPDGEITSAKIAGGGQIDVYETLEGSPVTSYVLPDGLDLSKATPETIAALGLPPRPAAADQQQVWDDAFGGPTNSGPSATPCETQINNTHYSANWSGRADTKHVYTSAQGQFTVPTFSAACAHASAHSIWAGIGGYVSPLPGLIQAGIDTSQNGVDNVYPFLEVWPLEHEIQVGVPTLSAGDVASVVVVYDNGTAYFTIKNLSTGVHHTYDQAGVYGYYDSRSTEWIDERPENDSLAHPVDGKYYYYRKSTKTHWTGVRANGQVAGHWTTTKITMRRSNGNVLSTASLPTTASDVHTWKRCS